MTHAVSVAVLLVSVAFGLPARAAGFKRPPVPVWSGKHALVIPERRLELGLFGSSHYGWRGLEFSLHPIWFFALPHVEMKVQTGAVGVQSLSAMQLRLSYPTAFLKLIAREGAGGLLPNTSSPPQTVQLEFDYLLTAFSGPLSGGYRHMATVSVGAAVAVSGSFTPRELPLLDFPFAYPRLAAVYAGGVPRFALHFEGPLLHKLHYELSATYYALPDLPDVSAPFALEPAGQFEYRFNDQVAVSLGIRTSVAKYPYGTRFHALPYADVRVGF